jgi:hypothetical protein
MTVGDLRAALADVSDDTLVVLSKDGEGNGFSPLADADTDSMYVPHTTWSGETKLKTLTPELQAQGFAVEDTAFGFSEAVEAVVLWPVN